MTSINNDVCGLPIQGVPNSVKLFQSRQRVGHVQQGAIPIMPSALIEQNRGNIQIDHPPGFVEPSAIFRVDNNAPPCCQNNSIRSGELLDSLSLPPPKAFLAFDFKDGRNRNTGSIDDLMVGIQERPRQAFGDLAPDGRFSSPHQSDEIYVATIFHSRILSD